MGNNMKSKKKDITNAEVIRDEVDNPKRRHLENEDYAAGRFSPNRKLSSE